MATRRSIASTENATDLRQRILDASEQLLETEGLSALSMREVARRSGVTHQAPYHHFADRESILAELVTRGFDELTRRLVRANARHVPGQSLRLRIESGEAYVGFAIDHPGVFRIMFRPEVCDAMRFPAARAASERAYAELQRMVSLAHGEVAEEGMSAVYWAQVHGLACLLIDGPVGRQIVTLRERKAFMRESLTRFISHMSLAPVAG